MPWSSIKAYNAEFYIPASQKNKSYKLCRLPNGILTLLVSDPTEQTTGCSLSAATGSHNDPDSLPGLAHLCEHMILAGGSRKYPDPDLFRKLIARGNGSQNAFTTGELTTFYFQVSGNSDFDYILDIFSSLFRHPLFNKVLINKEIYAIQSEHENNRSSPGKLFYHGMRLLANPNHQFSRFCTGNIETLSPGSRKGKLKSALIEYFQTNFTGSRITLCIQGPHSLSMLAKLALKHFATIQDGVRLGRSSFGSLRSLKSGRSYTDSRASYTDNETCTLRQAWRPNYTEVDCFDKSSKCNGLLIKCCRKPALRLVFPICEKKTRFNSRDIKTFSNIWCELFGSESAGSFCYFLKEAGWIHNCEVFVSEYALYNSGLNLQLSLTELGLQNATNLISILLDKVIKFYTSIEPQKMAGYLSEINSAILLNFAYKQNTGSVMDECSELSNLLQERVCAKNNKYLMMSQLPLLFEQLFKDYYKDANVDWWVGQAIKFQSFINEFVTKPNLRLILLGDLPTELIPGHKKLFEQPSTDTAYEFEYSKFQVYFNKEASKNIQVDLQIPEKNLFLPSFAKNLDNFRKLFTTTNEYPFNNLEYPGKLEHIPIPQLVDKNARYELWVSSSKLGDKKSLVSFKISSATLEPSPENTINLEILGQLLYLTLYPSFYNSLSLGYTYEIAASPNGDVSVVFTFSGFEEGINILITDMMDACVKTVTNIEFPSKQLFRRARVLVRNKYEEASSDTSIKLATVGLLIALEPHMWGLEDRMESLEDIDITIFKKFCKQFFRECKYIQIFMEGLSSVADTITHTIDSKLSSHPCMFAANDKIAASVGHRKVLKPGANTQASSNAHSDDPNNSIVYFIQTATTNNKTGIVFTLLTAYIMFLTVIPQIRNEKQVGYVVLGGLRMLADIMGVHITIMSSLDPIDLEAKIDEYFSELEKTIQGDLDESKFQHKFVKPFLNSLKTTNFYASDERNGPVNILDELVANVSCGEAAVLNSEVMRRHRRQRNRIFEGCPLVSEYYNLADLCMCSGITLKKYLLFYKQNLSIQSPTRRKLSVLVRSPMSRDELIFRTLFLQIDSFLKINGFAISHDELKRLVERSQGNSTLLIKELFKFFSSKGQAWRLGASVSKELTKAVYTGVQQNARRLL